MKITLCFAACLGFTVLFGQVDSAFSFRNGPSHSGIYPSKNYSSFGNLLMKFKTGGKIFSSPLCDGTAVYFGSGDGNAYAIDIRTKKMRWKFATGGAVHSSPALFRKVLYFGSYDGYFYAVDANSGKLKWKFKTEGEKKVGAKGLWTMKPATEYMEDPYDFFLSSPVVDPKNSMVYFGSGDGNVYALHINNGDLVWKFKTDGVVHSSPALYDGILYIGSWDKFLYALDARTGKEKWKFRTGEDSVYHLLEGIQASPAVYNGTLYFGVRDGYFYALDPSSGALKWKYSANNSWILTTPSFKDDKVFIGTSDTYQFIALDAHTGKEIFKVQANGYIYSSPSIAGDLAYFGDFTGQMFMVDLNAKGKISDIFQTEARKSNAGKVLLKNKIDFGFAANGKDLYLYSSTVFGMDKLYSLGPIVSSPMIYNSVIYFGDASGYLYALALKEK